MIHSIYQPGSPDSETFTDTLSMQTCDRSYRIPRTCNMAAVQEFIITIR